MSRIPDLSSRWWLMLPAGLLLFMLVAVAGEPKLNIVWNGTNAFVWVSGGVSNTQYWVRTSNDYSPVSTNWYDWRRFYSADFYTNTVQPVFDPTAPTNTAISKPQRYFKLGGVVE